MTKEDAGDPKTIAVTGATGLIGGRVVEMLLQAGRRVLVLGRSEEDVRSRFGDDVAWVAWDCFSKADGPWVAALDGTRAIIHLAGIPLFARRWTPAFLEQVAASRIESSRHLVEAASLVDQKPEAFISASAIGFYGTQAGIDAAEDHVAADDVLARMCVDWEAACRGAGDLGMRDVQVRVGIVLSPKGGALKEMLTPFRFGLGGVMGKPEPWINWIHLDDIARIIVWAVEHENLRGPVNGVAPQPVTNATFAKTLAGVLRRPCLFRMPSAALRLLLGPAAEFISGGARVHSDVLPRESFSCQFQTLESALTDLLT